MAARYPQNPINPDFTLSARQEELLYAALNSNKATNIDTSIPLSADTIQMSSADALRESPLQAPGSGTLSGFEESPFIDYDYDFDGDGSFDFDFHNDSQGQMIGNLPGTSSDGDAADTHDKRSHPDDDGEEEEGGGKRREGEDKSSKKPGRKPLTSEPTSKRKAQNRAAQRAFRERKEKHLKDLETKVEDLQKASESANHENSILRAQIERMSAELREYKKRLSVTGSINRSSPGSGLPPYLANKGLGGGAVHNPNDVNFSFEFPRFGRLPGLPVTNGSSSIRSMVSPTPSAQTPTPTHNNSIDKGQVSPHNQSSPTNTFTNAGLTQTPAQIEASDMASLSGLFTPGFLDSASKSSPFEFFGNGTSKGSISSTDSANGQNSSGHNTSYSSPSASSNSNNGASSSCGTSPEPSVQSPVYNKPLDSTLTTIGEENTCSNNTLPPGELTFCEKLNMACGNPHNPIPRTMSEPGVNSGTEETPAFDINGIDWFAQQNNNQFDPQLFGDYREPQDNVLSNEAFNDGFFTDAFDIPDFNSPFNAIPSPAAPKKDLVQQIDAKQNDDEEVVPAEDRTQMLNCNTIWYVSEDPHLHFNDNRTDNFIRDRLQNCPRVKEGEFDLDGLCKDLQKKAKCSETGAVVNEADFNKIMQSYAKDKSSNCGVTNNA
ncbi:Transcription factor PAP1 protein [Rutstroemia sp. NJR-2017a BVV2]|nr:Transcription factor PAP1 protein [Rutstroemia sp. NJR-2017a BVV2]